MLSLEDLLIVFGVVFKAALLLSFVFIARGVCWLVNLLVLAPPFDPLRKLPGPDAGAFQNHFRAVSNPARSPQTHEQWVNKYGKTFRFHGFGRHDYRLMSFDLRAISHILNSPIYEKPWQTRRLLSRLLGRGISVMEGDEHKSLRRLISPAFTAQSIKALTHLFVQKAEELRDRWNDLLFLPSAPHQSDSSFIPIPPTRVTSDADNSVVDVLNWFGRAMFDVIGLAGFDYQFNALRDESEEMYIAYRSMFNVVDKGPGLKGLLMIFFPTIEKLFPDDSIRTTKQSLEVIKRVGLKLIENKRVTVLAEKTSVKDIKEKDILSLLLKSNLSENPAQRMPDATLLDQLTTFLFAGSDSTSVALAWCVHYLSLDPDVQTRLKDELAALSSSPASDGYADALDALPLLDAVVREALRLSPPIHATIRVATRDDAIPLSEPVLLRDGTMVSEVRIRKGSYVHVPIEGLNTCKEVWGADALGFNPDRWLNRSPSTHPGIANMMTFSFGPHACPGWRFTLLEIKVFLAALLPHYAFSPAEEIRKSNVVLTRPYVRDKFELGARLPVKIVRR